MRDTYNGMAAGNLEGAIWKKSRRSNSQGACVEMARLEGAAIAMRNSRDPEGAALIYPRTAISALIDGLREGEFDQLVS
jgi:hypothetical protein